MNRKKGFTLIELLAIIVILAIIAVITVPLILNIINDAQKNASIDSAYGYKSAIEKYYMKKVVENTENELPNGYKDVSELPEDFIVSGDAPSDGWVKLKKGIVDKFSLKYDDYVVTMDNEKNVTSEKQENVDPRVPDEYKEVEYLESTGTQYIDTGVIPNDYGNKLGFKTSVYQVVKQNNSSWVLGTNTSSGRFFNVNMGTNNRWAIYAGTDSAVQLFSVPATTPAELNTWYDIDATIINGGTNRLSINGTEFTSQGIEVTSLKQIKLFSFGSASSSFIGRIKGLKLINPENNKTIRNLVPVVRKSDNKPGLLDLANRTNNLINYTKSESGGINASGQYVTSINLWRGTEYIPIKQVEHWFSIEKNILRIYYYTDSKEFISRQEFNSSLGKTGQLTIPENTKYIKWTIYANPSASMQEVEEMQIMLNEGTEALPYEPYKKSFYTNDGTGEFITGPEI